MFALLMVKGHKHSSVRSKIFAKCALVASIVEVILYIRRCISNVLCTLNVLNGYSLSFNSLL